MQAVTPNNIRNSLMNELCFQFFRFLFCSSWVAIISFRRERGLMVFFPRLKLLIAHSASLDRRDRSLVENGLVSARICSKYFGSTPLRTRGRFQFRHQALHPGTGATRALLIFRGLRT